MMNNNKILTVSYGTFSCTLEGFDDSFDTMKAIAEYFRDLAADDRYFGAEPPQPDAELLARIAEREVSRRVEAQEHEGRILLKAHEDAVEDVASSSAADLAKTAAPAAPAVQTEDTLATQAASTRTEAPVEAAALSKSETPDVTEIDSPPVVATPAAADVDDGPDAYDDLVDANIAATVDQSIRAQDVMPLEDAPAQSFEEKAFEEQSDEGDIAMPMSDDAAAAEPSEMDAFFAQSVSVDVAQYDGEEAIDTGDFTDSLSPADGGDLAEDTGLQSGAEQLPSDTDETFAEKLDRIRAVVSQQDVEEEVSGYEEDLEAAPAVADFADFNTAFVDADPKHPAQDVMSQAAQDIAEAFEQDEASFEPSEIEEADEVERAEDDLDDILKRMELGTTDDAATDNLFSEDDPEEEVNPVTGVAGRVLKVDRTDLEAALASGDLEDLDDVAEEDASEPLLLDAGPDQQDPETDTPRQSLPEIDAEASEDVSRLMAEADHQMEEPEGKTRRSAFAHLRAAVAARFADRSMDMEEQLDDAEAEAYRNDLAEVVRPRRPESSDNRTERPVDETTAPLKLVAEQRIDPEHIKDAGPISPRRVSASDDEFELPSEDDGGFATYAAERGASTLPELLEAAAAYLSYVEGHEQFSRPELMSRVRQVDCGDFSREDGLRSFGQLLRTGKIEKIKGGRFTATEGIGYKPGHLAAG